MNARIKAMHFLGTFLLFAGRADAVDVSIAWDAPTVNADGSPLTGGLRGYNVYEGPVRGGPNPLIGQNVGNPSFTLQNLQTGSHFVVVTSVDLNDNESVVSNELALHINIPDSDGDGLSDPEEAGYGTAGNNPDTDGDGIRDGQEASDGTNPLDAGSFREKLSNTFCSEWNGFFQGRMWNIAEHVNLAGATRSVTSALSSISGAIQSQQAFSVLVGAQTDILVHDMPGRIVDSYGKVCSSVGGAPGDIDGRMVHYLPSASGFEFALSMPFSNGLTGSQFLPYNTYEPSLDPADAGDFVANWIQITNQESTFETGDLIFAAQSGAGNGMEPVTLQGGARADFSGHRFGADLVGLAEWRPRNPNARFQVRNVRYYYSTASSAVESFDSALQLEGQRGSGEQLVVPLDTRDGSAILEIGNTLATAANVLVRIVTAAGNEVFNAVIPLPARGSIHLIADDLLHGELGMAIVDGTIRGGTVATGMQYGRTSRLGTKYIFGTNAVQALGAVLKGSYNTFLSQGCSLLLANSTAAAQAVTIYMRRYEGTSIVTGDRVTVPANGVFDYDACSKDSANNYGVITVQPARRNTIAATVVRKGMNDDYRFSTPVR